MTPGKLIVIEGTDGSGKTTQCDLLLRALKKANVPARLVSFPRYGHPAAYFAEQYLSGAFGKTENVDMYAASLFYALDRYQAAPQFKQWLREGKIIIANRYTTSSMIHHSPEGRELPRYLQWLTDIEWNILRIPKPDLVFFLDVPPQISLRLVRQRATKDTSRQLDMVEKDKAYTVNSYAKSERIVRLQQWRVIPCVNRKGILGKEQIAAALWVHVARILNLER